MARCSRINFAILIGAFALSAPFVRAQSSNRSVPMPGGTESPDGTLAPALPSDTQSPATPTKKTSKKAKTRTNGKKKPSKKDSASSEPGFWFPYWPTPSFDWGLAPVVGIKYTANTDPTAGRTKAITSEIGLHAGLSGVPLRPGNPGLYIAPSAGYALGRVVGMTQNAKGDWKTENLGYKRMWGGNDFNLLAGTLSYTLGLDRGRKTFSDLKLKPVQSAGLKNDLAVLVTSLFAVHYTHQYLHVFEDQFMEPLLVQHDNWLHGRLSLPVLAYYLDIGPGYTFARQYNTVDGFYDEFAHGQTEYLLGLTGMQLFWKLGMSGRAKYVFKSSEKQLGAYAGLSLPESGLNDVSPVSTPEDSFQGSLFFGANDVMYGLGVGWQYNLQILNVSAKGDKERVTTKDSGFSVNYQKSF